MNEFRCSLLGGDDCERLAEDIESLRTSLASARAAIMEKDEALSLARDRMGLAINALPVKDIPEDLWAAFHIAKDALTTDGTELAALLDAIRKALSCVDEDEERNELCPAHYVDLRNRLAAFERKGEG